MYNQKNKKKTGVFDHGRMLEVFKEKARHASFYLFLLLSLILITSLVRNVSRILSAGERIDATRSQIEALEKDNAKLREKIDDAKSDLYVERTIRDKLGLSKPGETVVVLPDTDYGEESKDQGISSKNKLEKNWEKWLSLFAD